MQPKFTQPNAKSFSQLRHDVYQTIRESSSLISEYQLLSKALLFTFAGVVGYTLVLMDGFNLIIRLLGGITYGAAILLLAINISHEAVHHTLTNNKKFNNFVHYCIFTLLGVDPYLWSLRHIKSHHVFPNVNGVDVDIQDNPIIRLSPHHSWHPYQRFQHIYAPFAYCLTLCSVAFYQDYVYLKTRKMANIDPIPFDAKKIFFFFLSKIVYLLMMILIPMFVGNLSLLETLLGFLIVSSIGSIIFVGALIGTHFFAEAAFPDATHDKALKTSHSMHQLMTSLDWHPKNRIINFLVGGINAHAAHHLFPNISHPNYVTISKYIEQMADDFNLPYHRTSFIGMVKSHFRLLRMLGAKPA